MTRPEDLGIFVRCFSCGMEYYQCRTSCELGYGRCCYHCRGHHPDTTPAPTR